jgi:hypothetical protein
MAGIMRNRRGPPGTETSTMSAAEKRVVGCVSEPENVLSSDEQLGASKEPMMPSNKSI